MLEKLMPSADGFYDDFDAQCATTLAGARLFHALLHDYRDVPFKVEALERMEREGNSVNHAALGRLHAAFIAPFERTRVHALLARIDEVLDYTHAAAVRLQAYDIQSARPEALELGELLVALTEKLRELVGCLRFLRQPERLLAKRQELKRLERRTTDVLRAARGELFKSGLDHLTVLKWKEIYDTLQHATLKCRAAVDVVDSVVLEYA